MINVKIFAHNKIKQEIVLFECDVFDQDNYEVITDIGKIYEDDFARALRGKFSVEVYNKQNKQHESETITIDNSDWKKNIESYGKYMIECYGVSLSINSITYVASNHQNDYQEIETKVNNETNKEQYSPNKGSEHIYQYAHKYEKIQGDYYGKAA